MNHYGLNPAWYFSASGLAWDASLKLTKVQLELLSDPDMLLMIESGIREGIAQYLTAMLKPTTSTWELSSILLRNLNSSRIYMLISFMVGQCHSNFQRLGLNG